MAANSTISTPPSSYYTESHAHWVIYSTILFSVVCPIFTLLRFWARHRTAADLSWDDLVIVMALAFAMATNALFLVMVHYGFGFHMLALPVPNRIEVLFLYWVSQLLYKISLQLTKISILLFFQRIFGHLRWFSRLSKALIAILAVYAIVSCMVGALQCVPVRRSWDRSVTGDCFNLQAFFISNAVFATFSDLVILVMPMAPVYRLRLPLAQKIGLIPVFGLGLVIVAISALRLSALVSNLSVDTTYDLLGTLCTIIEYNLAIVCANLPIAHVLLVRQQFIRICSIRRFLARSRKGDGTTLTAGSAARTNSEALTETTVHGGYNKASFENDTAYAGQLGVIEKTVEYTVSR